MRVLLGDYIKNAAGNQLLLLFQREIASGSRLINPNRLKLRFEKNENIITMSNRS